MPGKYWLYSHVVHDLGLRLVLSGFCFEFDSINPFLVAMGLFNSNVSLTIHFMCCKYSRMQNRPLWAGVGVSMEMSPLTMTLCQGVKAMFRWPSSSLVRVLE